MQPIFVIVVVLASTTTTISAGAATSALSFIVNTGKEICFYQTVHTNENITVDYIVNYQLQIGIIYDWKVIIVSQPPILCFFACIVPTLDQMLDGDSDENGVYFAMLTTHKTIEESTLSTASVTHHVQSDGEYELCFAVPFLSMLRTRKIFMQVEIDDGTDVDNTYSKTLFHFANGTQMSRDDIDGFVHLQVGIQLTINALEHIRGNLTRSRQIQMVSAAHTTHDANLALHNNWMVQAWSIFQIVLMIGVGSLQIIIVRSFFKRGLGEDTKSIPLSYWVFSYVDRVNGIT